MSAADTDVDLLIIGAGPVGLYGTYYAGFRDLRVGLMDSLPELGGQISAMYPEKQIYDIAGFPEVKGRDLVRNLVKQAERFAPRYYLGRQAHELTRTPDPDGGSDLLTVSTHTGEHVRCRAVIITGGIGVFKPRPLPAGSEFEGRGLAYFVPELDDYADTDVVIVGGGDSAFDWAQTLRPITRSITLVHRRDTFRAHAGTVKAVRESDVEIVTGAQVSEVTGNGSIESVEVATAVNNAAVHIDPDEALFPGHSTDAA